MADLPTTSVFISRRLAEWQLALWSIFLVAFASAGALPLRRIGLRDRIQRSGPASSTDTIFARDLRLEDATRKISGALNTIPSDTPVAVVSSSGSVYSLPACLIHQLAWPRPAVFIEPPKPANGKQDELLDAIRTSGAKGIFFLRANPPPSLQATEWSPYIQFCRLP